MPSFDWNTGAGRRSRANVFPEMFPDPRPVDRSFSPVPGAIPATTGQRGFSCVSAVESAPAGCAPILPNCECPHEEDLDASGRAQALSFRMTPFLCDNPMTQGERSEFTKHFARVVERGDNRRFIPRSHRVTHAQDSSPFQGWAPCLFEKVQNGTESPLARFRRSIAVDLANQLLVMNLQRLLLWGWQNREFCESLGADDGERFWCECDPCRSTNSVDGGNDACLLFKGRIFVTNLDTVFPNRSSPAASLHPWFSQDASQGALRIGLAHAALLRIRDGLAGVLNQFSTFNLNQVPASVSSAETVDVLDRMALRGVIPDRVRLNKHTRRLLVLLNETALSIAEALTFPSSYRGPSVPAGFVPLSPVLPGLFDLSQTLLTFLAYLDYTAPPIFEIKWTPTSRDFYPEVTAADFAASPARSRELAQNVLHPVLTPVIAGSRDLVEYDDRTYATRAPADRDLFSRPFEQQRMAPEQFNLRRWSMIANQTGFYEYMYGGNNLAPRLYTSRLRNALRQGYERSRARVFIAEVLPHWGLDGIKLYETAHLLWDVNAEPADLRAAFCRAAFGPRESTIDLMRTYFNELERIWCDRERGRNPAKPLEQRLVSGFNPGTFSGFGVLGRSGHVSELEPYLWTAEERQAFWNLSRAEQQRFTAPTFRETPFWRLWQIIEQAYQAESGSGRRGPAFQRIQYFRRAMGLVGQMIEVYLPIWSLWLRIEPSFDVNANDPLTWAEFPASGTRVLGARAASMMVFRHRLALTDALRPMGWAQVAGMGFRQEVREPLHQYIMLASARSVLGGELGLGLGRGAYTPGGLIELNPEAVVDGARGRDAFSLRALQAYSNWWRDHGQPRTRASASPAVEAQQGIAATLFLSIKNVIATMMMATALPTSFLTGSIESAFSREQVIDFLRDA